MWEDPYMRCIPLMGDLNYRYIRPVIFFPRFLVMPASDTKQTQKRAQPPRGSYLYSNAPTPRPALQPESYVASHSLNLGQLRHTIKRRTSAISVHPDDYATSPSVIILLQTCLFNSALE